MHHLRWAFLTIWLAPAIALATREPTVPPVYYLIDYSGNHLDNAEYIEWIRELPPDLLHVGKDVPMTHIWGPIAAVGGENQAHGRKREDIRRLTPAEVRERIEALRRLTTAVRQAGVKAVMPYTSAITYAGHPETREGLFEFFDHWDDYAGEFGLGSKPASDPIEWAARTADGAFHTFGKHLQPDYFAGLYRYVACIEHPDWRHWLVQVHRLVAVAGYDGAFPDNSSPIRCHAPYCRKAFARYLEEKFTPQQRHELFGTAELGAIELPKERKGLLWVEANRFWQTSLARLLRELREGGRQVNPEFQLFPNCGSPLQSAEYLAGNVDYFMLEGGTGPQGAGCLITPIIGDIYRRSVKDNILELRYAAGIPGDIRPMLLKLGRTPEARQLCLAEAAAFGSGAYNGVRPSSRAVQRPFIEFLQRNRDLYDGKISAARVALLFFPMRSYYPGSRHWLAAFRVKDALGVLQIPFDCFSEGGLTLTKLQTYDACIVPEMKYLADEHVDILRRYVESGGRLLLLGGCATHDELCRPRDLPPGWFPTGDGERTIGKGAAVHRALSPSSTEMAELLAPAGDLRLLGSGGKLERPMLRVMAYQADGELIVHLLNYNCPIEPTGAEAIAERNIPVRISLPVRANVAAVTCLSPDRDAQSLAFRVTDGVCRFTVPEVPVYAVCVITLQ